MKTSELIKLIENGKIIVVGSDGNEVELDEADQELILILIEMYRDAPSDFCPRDSDD